ncbi:nonstructural protein [Blackfly microvirus SF02]|uniref:Nonstructural protein n=1 Tax=Blackfly microvirus SF02 TaxID=2576452 RepID=A0A4P8PKA0_9VIRU|nr:nonstructural protein [Blackfly microvirus SF02]
MLSRLYSVYDSKALAYSPPFMAGTDGLAVRMLTELVSDNITNIGRHPSDFRLYCVGMFDDQSGGLAPLAPAEHIVDAVALVPYQKKLPLEESP